MIMKKRESAISILLTIVLILSLIFILPPSVFAEGGDEVPDLSLDVSLDNENETISGTEIGMEYVVATSGAAVDWENPSPTAITSEGALDISDYIVANGVTPNSIHIRYAADPDSEPSGIEVIPLPARPAAPTAADFVVTQPTASTGDNSKGSIKLAEGEEPGDYQYLDGTTEGWEEMEGTMIAPPSTIIEFRFAATESDFASETYLIKINAFVPSSSHRGSSTPKAPVIVDGETYDIGKSVTSNGETVVILDQTALKKQLDAASEEVVVPITPGKNVNTVVAELLVANVEEMAQKEMTLSVQVDNVSYDMPAVAIDTSQLLDELGASSSDKVPLNVSIKLLANDDVNLEEGELLLSPIQFTVLATFADKKAEVEVFERYVQRVIEVSDVDDTKKITTAVVTENGKQRHVPTEVFKEDTKWFARINSLTNSTYAIIQNEQSFSDAEGKWYEAIVTEMASRGIIDGKSEGLFDGEAAITRAEFAAILVRALGLPENGDASMFSDVASTAWYYGAVGKAYEYGLVGGRGEGIFDPAAKITRQEAMAMIYNASEIAPIQLLSGINPGQYNDMDEVSEWAKDAASFNLINGLIVGSDGNIRPTDNISRSESATVILRLLQKSGMVDVRSEA